MGDWQQDTFDDYRKKGFASRMGFGAKPALLVVDFIVGFTDPASPLGGDFSRELDVTAQLQAVFRGRGLPIAYTTIAYDKDFKDAGLFIKKVPSLSVLRKGTSYVEVDPRIRPMDGELIVEKKYASAFFSTNLHAELQRIGVDTLIMTGCTTSGCIRASAIDSLQNGYYTSVVREGVGDRAQGPHEANLFDIDAKYGDVIELREALDYLNSHTVSGGMGDQANGEFRRFWNKEPA